MVTGRAHPGGAGPEWEPKATHPQRGEETDSPPRPEDRGGSEPADSRVDALEARVAELEDRWKRALADVDNVRKRLTGQIAGSRAEERRRVAMEWLPIIDNLDLALGHADGDPTSIVEGVRAVREEALAVLERLGFDLRHDLGLPFDPHLHEAAGTVATDEVDPGTIIHVVRPGYGEGEDQLRPATVVVARPPS